VDPAEDLHQSAPARLFRLTSESGRDRLDDDLPGFGHAAAVVLVAGPFGNRRDRACRNGGRGDERQEAELHLQPAAFVEHRLAPLGRKPGEAPSERHHQGRHFHLPVVSARFPHEIAGEQRARHEGVELARPGGFEATQRHHGDRHGADGIRPGRVVPGLLLLLLFAFRVRFQRRHQLLPDRGELDESFHGERQVVGRHAGGQRQPQPLVGGRMLQVTAALHESDAADRLGARVEGGVDDGACPLGLGSDGKDRWGDEGMVVRHGSTAQPGAVLGGSDASDDVARQLLRRDRAVTKQAELHPVAQARAELSGERAERRECPRIALQPGEDHRLEGVVPTEQRSLAGDPVSGFLPVDLPQELQEIRRRERFRAERHRVPEFVLPGRFDHPSAPAFPQRSTEASLVAPGALSEGFREPVMVKLPQLRHHDLDVLVERVGRHGD